MLEVSLDRWLPTGWAGTADWIQWSSEYRAFVLGDLKTIKPEGMRWIEQGGIKEEHMWQVSAYWHALKKMGLPLVKAFNVYYLPMQPLIGEPNLEPLLLEAKPLEEEVILPVMESRWVATRDYLNEWAETSGKMKWPNNEIPPGQYLNSKLAPVQERRQVIRWNKPMGVFDVKLEPHWSADYCPFPDELCDCRHGKREKIGHFSATETAYGYAARKGFEEIKLEVELDNKQKEKLFAS